MVFKSICDVTETSGAMRQVLPVGLGPSWGCTQVVSDLGPYPVTVSREEVEFCEVTSMSKAVNKFVNSWEGVVIFLVILFSPW